MAITSERLHKQSVVIKQICKLFPQRKVNIDGERKDRSSGQYDQICNARLPRALDPYSVPSDELDASLGSKLNKYDEVVDRLVHHLNLDDPSKIRLTSHNCYSQQPKPQPIKSRGVEHLSDMLAHYNQIFCSPKNFILELIIMHRTWDVCHD